MNWDKVKEKLGSRKLWALIAGLVTVIAILFKADAGQVESIVATVGAAGAVVVYIFAQGQVDIEKEKNKIKE